MQKLWLVYIVALIGAGFYLIGCAEKNKDVRYEQHSDYAEPI